jgi:CRP-like cAMP-binding protein
MLVVQHKIKTKLPIIDVEAGMILFERGDSDETIYLLIEGGVSIYTESNNTEHVIAEIKKYQFFGDAEIYSHTPRTTSAKTTTNSKLVMIKTLVEFERFVSDNCWLSGKLMESLSEQLVQANTALTTKMMATSAVKVELNPNIRPEDKSARRIIHR